MPFRVRPLAFRISLAITVLLGALVVGLTIWQTGHTRRHLERALLDDAVQSSNLVLLALEGYLQSTTLRSEPHDLSAFLRAIGEQSGVRHARIHARGSLIRASNRPEEIGRRVDLSAEGCPACHSGAPGSGAVRPNDHYRIWMSPRGEREMRVIRPIPNAPACSEAPCHAHPPDRRVLGMLDINLSLANIDRVVGAVAWNMGLSGVAAGAVMIALVVFLVRRMVHRPIRGLIEGTRRIAGGDLDHRIPPDSGGDLGELAESFNAMTERLEERTRDLRLVSAAIDGGTNLMFLTDRDGRILFANRRFQEVTQYSAEEAIGQTPRILKSGDVPQALYEEMWATILAGRSWRGTVKNRTKSGGFYWADTLVMPVADGDGRITHFFASQDDITDRVQAKERIEHLTWQDALTGLPNRARFVDLVERCLQEARAAGEPAAVALLDLDRFHLVNDTFGHGKGDEHVRRVGEVLRGLVAARTFPGAARAAVARLGGDDFAVLLPGSEPGEALAVAEHIRRSVDDLPPLGDSGGLTASVGVAVFPTHAADAGELLAAADAALFRAKDAGRNRCHLFSPQDRDVEKMRTRIVWRERIQQALAEHRFVPWFQPILDLRDGGVHHYEALARLHLPDGQIVLPGAFIETAERFGLIGEIDRAIVESVMRSEARSPRSGEPPAFAMNLSAKVLGDPGMQAFIESRIRETGADPARLIFEITETAAIHDVGRARAFIDALRGLGCRFALDDFGVGFTSFAYLKEMRVDYIKIDGSFVRRLPESPHDRLFVGAMAGVARGMGIRTIAEFVENREIIRILVDMGVNFAQGFAIGKPAPDLLGPAAIESARALVTGAPAPVARP